MISKTIGFRGTNLFSDTPILWYALILLSSSTDFVCLIVALMKNCPDGPDANGPVWTNLYRSLSGSCPHTQWKHCVILNVRGLSWKPFELECNFLAPIIGPCFHGSLPKLLQAIISRARRHARDHIWSIWASGLVSGRKPIKAHHHQLAPASKCKTDGTLLASPSESSIVHVELIRNTWKHMETHWNIVQCGKRCLPVGSATNP